MHRRFFLAVAAAVLATTVTTSVALGQASTPQLDQIEAITRETKQSVETLKQQSWIRDWGPLFGAFVAAGVAIFSLFRQLQTAKEVAKQNLDMADRTLREKAREEERKALREKIDQFYGPFVQLRGMSSYLYKMLFLSRRSEQEHRDYSDGKRYRTVIALVRSYKFSPEDLEILKKIVAIGNQTAELIQSKIGYVDKEELVQVLPHAVAHFWLIDKLVNTEFTVTKEEDWQHYEKLTFPESLDPALNAELKRLQDRLAILRS